MIGVATLAAARLRHLSRHSDRAGEYPGPDDPDRTHRLGPSRTASPNDFRALPPTCPGCGEYALRSQALVRFRGVVYHRGCVPRLSDRVETKGGGT